jgi:hypothetical protein
VRSVRTGTGIIVVLFYRPRDPPPELTLLNREPHASILWAKAFLVCIERDGLRFCTSQEHVGRWTRLVQQ